VRKIFLFLVVTLILNSLVFSIDEGVLMNVDGGSEAKISKPVEPNILYSFIPPSQCPIVYRFRATYTDAYRDGEVINRFGVRCEIGDRIELVACLLSGDTMGNTCYRIFGDDYLKESNTDLLDVRYSCSGALIDNNCYSAQWFLDAINGKYVGYNCRHCPGSEHDCLDANPLNICKTASYDGTPERMLDNTLSCPSLIPYCWVPAPSQPNTPCDIILSESSLRSNCRQVDGGICSGDDRYYCNDGYAYAYDYLGVTYLLCVLDGKVINPSFTTCPNGCKNGECEAQLCLPNQKFCSGQKVMKCSSDGKTISVEDTCDNTEYCVEEGAFVGCKQITTHYGITCAGTTGVCNINSLGEFVDLSKCQLAASSYCSDDPKPIVESGIDSDGFDISNVSPLLAGILVVGGGIAFILLVIGIVFLLRKK